MLADGVSSSMPRMGVLMALLMDVCVDLLVASCAVAAEDLD